MSEGCQHLSVELEHWDKETATAECRACGMVCDVDLFYNEWMTPEDYDRMIEAQDEFFTGLKVDKS